MERIYAARRKQKDPIRGLKMPKLLTPRSEHSSKSSGKPWTALSEHPWGRDAREREREFKDLYCFPACKINCTPSWGVKTRVAIQVGCRDTRRAQSPFTITQFYKPRLTHNKNISPFIKIFQSFTRKNIWQYLYPSWLVTWLPVGYLLAVCFLDKICPGVRYERTRV